MMKSWRLSALVALLVLTFAAPAAAQDQSELSAALRGLDWNASKAEVIKWFKQVKAGEFKEESSKLKDPLLKEDLRRKKAAEIQRIESTYKKLSGERTGFEVSVITGEFVKNNGESLMVSRDDFSQKYYLFSDGRLWKLVIAYNTEYIQDIGFEAFVDQVARKYGDPDETQYDEETGGSDLARAIWRDEDTELRIENKGNFFNTFTMVFANRQTAERMANIRSANSSKKKTEVSRAILDVEEEDDFAVNEDIVDSLTGSRTDVDLESGMREDRELKRVGFEAQAANAEADLPDEEVKKKKKAKRGTARKKPAATKKSKDLIIY